jgi:electron transport complex protein RnfB
MQFGISSRFAVERGIARNVTKEEAKKILKEAEEAGLVHCTSNIQEPFFICNCCSCHCLGIHRALKEPNPGNIFSSGYQAIPEEGKCILCGDCLEICPSKAIVIDDEVLIVDYQKCFGCGLCASKCPEDAILMKAKEDAIEPPVDMAGLKKAIMTAAEHK